MVNFVLESIEWSDCDRGEIESIPERYVLTDLLSELRCTDWSILGSS